MTVRSQPLPTVINPDNRRLTFVTLDQDLDAILSDGDEREQHNRDLEDVRAMFTDNVSIHGGRQHLRRPAASSTPPPPRPPSPVPAPSPPPVPAGLAFIPPEVGVCNAMLEVNQRQTEHTKREKDCVHRMNEFNQPMAK